MIDENLKNRLLEALTNHAEGKAVDPKITKWVEAPKGSKCLGCGQETLERSQHILGGPWAGSVRCTACGHTESVPSYVGKSMVVVQPLTPEEVAEYVEVPSDHLDGG